MSHEDLIEELHSVVDEINTGINEVHSEFGGEAYKMRYRDGTYILLAALSAKAQALAAIAALEK